jgi:hypothetical protein
VRKCGKRGLRVGHRRERGDDRKLLRDGESCVMSFTLPCVPVSLCGIPDASACSMTLYRASEGGKVHGGVRCLNLSVSDNIYAYLDKFLACFLTQYSYTYDTLRHTKI